MESWPTSSSNTVLHIRCFLWPTISLHGTHLKCLISFLFSKPRSIFGLENIFKTDWKPEINLVAQSRCESAFLCPYLSCPCTRRCALLSPWQTVKSWEQRRAWVVLCPTSPPSQDSCVGKVSASQVHWLYPVGLVLFSLKLFWNSSANFDSAPPILALNHLPTSPGVFSSQAPSAFSPSSHGPGLSFSSYTFFLQLVTSKIWYCLVDIGNYFIDPQGNINNWWKTHCHNSRACLVMGKQCLATAMILTADLVTNSNTERGLSEKGDGASSSVLTSHRQLPLHAGITCVHIRCFPILFPQAAHMETRKGRNE